MSEKPYALGGLLILLGFMRAAPSGERHYDGFRFRHALRRWQY